MAGARIGLPVFGALETPQPLDILLYILVGKLYVRLMHVIAATFSAISNEA